MRDSKLGDAALLVLAAVARSCRFGFDIMDETGLKSGSVYRALSRLEERKLLESSWEDPEEALREKRPRRRYYRLTDLGQRLARVEAERLANLVSVARAKRLVGRTALSLGVG